MPVTQHAGSPERSPDSGSHRTYRAVLPSDVDSQRRELLQLPVGEIQLWSHQRQARLDLLESFPGDIALTTPATKHLVPIALRGPIHLLQRANISCDAVIGIVTAQHSVELVSDIAIGNTGKR